MTFMGPEESGVGAVTRSTGLVLVGIFAAGTFLSDATSPSDGGGKEVDGRGKCGNNGK
jgi:hypothetical protein